MKKQIVLAVLLLAGSPLVAMESEDSDTEQKENTESTEQSEEQPQVTPFCVLPGFSLWDQTSEAFQSMQDRANNVLMSMHLKKKCNGILNDLKELLVIEAQQEDDEKSEQSENGKDEKDEEIEQLEQLMQEQAKQLQKFKDELAKNQVIEDEAYANWLNEHQDEEQ